MKKYRLKEDFGGMKSGDIIETDGELGEVFPAGSFEVIEDAALEVATPVPERDPDAPHIDNQHDGVIPSHYAQVIAQEEVEQLKPKRGRPAKQD